MIADILLVKWPANGESLVSTDDDSEDIEGTFNRHLVFVLFRFHLS